ncbi:hypothetical protein [Kocuria rosea]
MQTHTARTEAARVDALHALKILDTPGRSATTVWCAWPRTSSG